MRSVQARSCNLAIAILCIGVVSMPPINAFGADQAPAKGTPRYHTLEVMLFADGQLRLFKPPRSYSAG